MVVARATQKVGSPHHGYVLQTHLGQGYAVHCDEVLEKREIICILNIESTQLPSQLLCLCIMKLQKSGPSPLEHLTFETQDTSPLKSGHLSFETQDTSPLKSGHLSFETPKSGHLTFETLKSGHLTFETQIRTETLKSRHLTFEIRTPPNLQVSTTLFSHAVPSLPHHYL